MYPQMAIVMRKIMIGYDHLVFLSGGTLIDNSTLWHTIKIDNAISVIWICLDHGDLMSVFRIVRETMGLIPHQSGFIRGWHKALFVMLPQGDAKKHAASCKKSPGKSLGIVCPKLTAMMVKGLGQLSQHRPTFQVCEIWRSYIFREYWKE